MNTKTVYLYDEETGEFTRDYEANPSPREAGKFIEPIHSTPMEPPQDLEGFTRNFIDGQWEYLPIEIPIIETPLLEQQPA